MEEAFILLLNFNHQGEGSGKAMTEILAQENPPVAWQPVLFLLHKSLHFFSVECQLSCNQRAQEKGFL